MVIILIALLGLIIYGFIKLLPIVFERHQRQQSLDALNGALSVMQKPTMTMAEYEELRDDTDEIVVSVRDEDHFDDGSEDDARWSEGERGPSASFSYVNMSGVRSQRTVKGWVSEGPHIKGWCKTAKDERTFRKSRISNWQVAR